MGHSILNWNGPPEERFWNHVYKTANCWFWIGALDRQGYGCLSVYGRTAKAHVFSYKMAFGDVLEKFQVLHRCDTKQCVRPDHLYAGDFSQNVRDRINAGSVSGQREFQKCVRGNP